jgi:hypothetical protein
MVICSNVGKIGYGVPMPIDVEVREGGPGAGRKLLMRRRRRARNAGEKRTIQLPVVMLNQSEMDAIRQAAAAANMAVGAWVGETLTAAASEMVAGEPSGVRGRRGEDLTPAGRYVLGELIKTQARVGNNVNQIARAWNVGDVVTPSQADAQAARLDRLLSDLIRVTSDACGAIRGQVR